MVSAAARDASWWTPAGSDLDQPGDRRADARRPAPTGAFLKVYGRPGGTEDAFLMPNVDVEFNSIRLERSRGRAEPARAERPPRLSARRHRRPQVPEQVPRLGSISSAASSGSTATERVNARPAIRERDRSAREDHTRGLTVHARSERRAVRAAANSLWRPGLFDLLRLAVGRERLRRSDGAACTTRASEVLRASRPLGAALGRLLPALRFIVSVSRINPGIGIRFLSASMATKVR